MKPLLHAWKKARSTCFLAVVVVIILYGLYIHKQRPDVGPVLPMDRYLDEEQKELIYQDIPIFRRRPRPFCQGLFENDPNVQKLAYEYMRRHYRQPITDEEYISMTEDCYIFCKRRSYVMDPLSDEEREYPVAFTISMYTNTEQLERLLRALYMPQNHYCIHVDSESQPSTFRAVRSIAKCFPNVIMASRQVPVKKGTMTELDADMNCMQDLLMFGKWKYLVNYDIDEMPLVSNRQLVRILKSLGGANDVELEKERLDLAGWILPILGRRAPVPYGLDITRGSLRLIASRDYVDFVANSPVANKLNAWLSQTRMPVEIFFSTLNYNPKLNVPGSFTGKINKRGPRPYLPFISLLTVSTTEPCGGKFENKVCVFGIKDLPRMKKRPEIRASKFHVNFEPLALDCWEEYHFNKTVESGRWDFSFDDRYYKAMPQSHFHVQKKVKWMGHPDDLHF